MSLVEVVSATEIQFTGANFPPEGCVGLFLGAASDSCDVLTDTVAVATFNTGVPTSPGGVLPELRFDAEDRCDYALVDEAAAVLRPRSVASTTSGLISSFAGGPTLEVVAEGLTSDVISQGSEVRVCGKPCEMIVGESTASLYACAVPAISTTGSNSEFTV